MKVITIPLAKTQTSSLYIGFAEGWRAQAALLLQYNSKKNGDDSLILSDGRNYNFL